MRTVLVILASAIVLLIALLVPPPLQAPLGRIDFEVYRSGAVVWWHGQDFSNPELIQVAEKSSFPMMPWAAPWLNVLLVPFLQLPSAALSWFVINLVLIGTATFLLAPRRPLAFLLSFTFVATLASLAFGQVNTLVLVGLACLRLLLPYRGLASGITLGLLTIKPHLMFITLPLALLYLCQQRAWRALIGLALLLLVWSAALALAYAGWVESTFRLLLSGVDTMRETPTLSGILTVLGQGGWAKWLSLPALVAFLGAWWKWKDRWPFERWFDLSIFASLFFTPFGWSYDQILLLVPVLSHLDRVTLSGLLALNGLVFGQRFVGASDVWFAWVPVGLAVLHLRAVQAAVGVRKQSALAGGHAVGFLSRTLK